jgi:hypothetical protein
MVVLSSVPAPTGRSLIIAFLLIVVIHMTATVLIEAGSIVHKNPLAVGSSHSAVEEWRNAIDFKIVGLVFYGRKEFVSILNCYLEVSELVSEVG